MDDAQERRARHCVTEFDEPDDIDELDDELINHSVQIDSVRSTIHRRRGDQLRSPPPEGSAFEQHFEDMGTDASLNLNCRMQRYAFDGDTIQFINGDRHIGGENKEVPPTADTRNVKYEAAKTFDVTKTRRVPRAVSHDSVMWLNLEDISSDDDLEAYHGCTRPAVCVVSECERHARGEQLISPKTAFF